jgi:hypothetical protein
MDGLSKHIDAHWTKYSKVSEALFIKTVRQTVAKNCRHLPFALEYIEESIANFSKKLEVIQLKPITIETQVYRKELSKIILCYHALKPQSKTTIEFFTSALMAMITEEKANASIDLAYVFMKQLRWGKIFKSLSIDDYRALSDFLVQNVLKI